MVKGFERLRDYIRCSLDTPEKQAACELYQRGDTEWCHWNRCGIDDICRCQKAKEILRSERLNMSQAQVIGRPEMKTWDDYEQGCFASFGGGHRSDGHLEAFQHGMSTVFNLLRSEFPPAEICKAAANRIGSQCWYLDADYRDRCGRWRRGRLQMWSTDHEEYENGPGPVPVGVVEDAETGRVMSVYVNRIAFSKAAPA